MPILNRFSKHQGRPVPCRAKIWWIRAVPNISVPCPYNPCCVKYFCAVPCPVPGSWYQDLGTKNLVPGSCYQDLGTRILVPGSWDHKSSGSGAQKRTENKKLVPIWKYNIFCLPLEQYVKLISIQRYSQRSEQCLFL